MKKSIILAVCAVFCMALCGCDNGNSNSSANSSDNSSVSSESSNTENSTSNKEETVSISDKTAKVLNEVKLPSMVEVKADKLNVYYGINEADIKEFSAYICGSGAAPDEFGIFTAKDEAAAKKIKEALDNRVQSQYDTFKTYTPDAMYRFDDDFVELNGTTVIYAICDNNEKAKEILK